MICHYVQDKVRQAGITIRPRVGTHRREVGGMVKTEHQ